MDERFPRWLRTVVGKLDFVGLPNLGMLICGLAVLGFIGTQMLGAPLSNFTFDPSLVRNGEWWRLFAFPVSEGLTNPIWLLFYVMYIYFVFGALENHWGPGPLTVFTGFSYACAIAGATLTNVSTNVWFHVLENVSLAFGTLFPEIEFYLFFVLPVKAKYLAMFAGALLILQFATGGMATKLFLLIALCPYLLFFGPALFNHLKVRYKVSRNRKRFGDD